MSQHGERSATPEPLARVSLTPHGRYLLERKLADWRERQAVPARCAVNSGNPRVIVG